MRGAPHGTRPPAGWLSRHAEVHALRAWSPGQLGSLAQALAPGLQAFASQWGLSTAPAMPQCRPFGASDTGPWLPAGSSGGWLRHDTDDLLARALFGEPCGPHQVVAREVIGELHDDLIATLGRVLGERSDGTTPDPTQVWRHRGSWSGWVVVELPLRATLPLLLDAESVVALLPPDEARSSHASSSGAPPRAAELVPVEAAAAARRLRVNVGLAPFELDVGSLHGLHVGDVLRLPHALDAPVHLATSDGLALCDAYLGRQGERKAVHLVRS